MIASEAKRSGAPSTCIWDFKQPSKISKNERRKFLKTKKIFIFHAKLIYNVNRPHPANHDAL